MKSLLPKNLAIKFLFQILFLAPILFFSCSDKKAIQLAENRQSQTLATKDYKIASFAGGCFWCMQPPYDKIDGVIKTIVGYMGGSIVNPTYKQVASGGTKHIESIQVYFDPTKISYKKLLEIFWKNIDPTDSNGQFVDRGKQYRPAIFYHNEMQKKEANNSKVELMKKKLYKKSISTEIISSTPFYPAENYHQSYYKKNPIRYKYYRYNSGRDQFLKKIWK